MSKRKKKNMVDGGAKKKSNTKRLPADQRKASVRETGQP